MNIRKQDFIVANWEEIQIGDWVEGFGEVNSFANKEALQNLGSIFQQELAALQKQSNDIFEELAQAQERLREAEEMAEWILRYGSADQSPLHVKINKAAVMQNKAKAFLGKGEGE